MATAARRATAVAPPAKRSESERSAKFPQATNLDLRLPLFEVADGLIVQTIFEGKISAKSWETKRRTSAGSMVLRAFFTSNKAVSSSLMDGIQSCRFFRTSCWATTRVWSTSSTFVLQVISFSLVMASSVVEDPIGSSSAAYLISCSTTLLTFLMSSSLSSSSSFISSSLYFPSRLESSTFTAKWLRETLPRIRRRTSVGANSSSKPIQSSSLGGSTKLCITILVREKLPSSLSTQCP